MSKKTLQVGDIVESACRKCNDITGHTIVSIVDNQIAKVECRGCGSVHKHRPAKKSSQSQAADPANPASKSKKAAPKGKKGPTAKEKEAQQIAEQNFKEWQSKVDTRDPAEAKPYSMDQEFETNDLIDHASFGLGIVQRTIPPNKMDVLFQNGEKRLRCADIPNTSALSPASQG
jgi:Zn ribbon nucleic-acid-binding protein